jgi:hypothetical protein
MTAAKTVTVNFAALPTVTWPQASSITYGEALSSATLMGGSASFNGKSVAGAFAFTTPTAVLKAGAQAVGVTFTPTDTTTYGAVSGTVTVTVKQATPTITWNTPAPITYGTALSSTQLNATASVAGTFSYNPAAGTVPAAGTDTLSVTFTPTDSTDYTSATASVKLVVNSAAAVINKITPALATAGGAAFTLTVDGAGFLPNSQVYWAGAAIPTHYTSGAQLTAQVSGAQIASSGSADITVQTPGGAASNTLKFQVDSADAGSFGPTFATVDATVTPGSSATYNVSLPSGAKELSVSCLNLPSGAQCSYASGVLTITTASTTPAGTYQVTVVFTETVPGAALAIGLLPILLLPLIGARKKMTAPGRIWFTLCLAVALTVVATATGCGDSKKTHQTTASGTVTLNVK